MNVPRQRRDATCVITLLVPSGAPGSFDQEDDAQIRTDIAGTLGPALGWQQRR